MANFVFPPAAPVVVDVASGGLFPVRRVFCVGQNYAEHAIEMGTDPTKESPVFFSKPADAVTSLAEIPYPSETANLHYEGELVVAIGQGGANIAAEEALSHVYGYAAGCDLTRRDLQAEAKKKGRPWDMAKGFDCSGAIGLIHPAAAIGHPTRGGIALSVNGSVRQKADLADLIWPVAHVLHHLSRFVALAPGDLIYTGTPAGVGPLVRGDKVAITIEGVASHAFAIV